MTIFQKINNYEDGLMLFIRDQSLFVTLKETKKSLVEMGDVEVIRRLGLSFNDRLTTVLKLGFSIILRDMNVQATKLSSLHFPKC
ncbi:hypothetical protein BKP57_03975 [Virgibacillus sp. 6R]|nr:hypothetical protein BKP57_03975 [Virgibacillus sp. 6R]